MDFTINCYILYLSRTKFDVHCIDYKEFGLKYVNYGIIKLI